MDMERLLEEDAVQESVLEEDDQVNVFKPQPEVTRLLRQQGIHFLIKRNPRFPWARWFCQTCEYHLVNLEKVRKHLTEARHMQLQESRTLITTLRLLPRPSPLHLNGIQSMLENVKREEGLNEDDLAAGEEVVRRVEKLLAAHPPGCTVHLAGSSLSGFGLLSSSMEFKLSLPPDCSPAGAMTSALQVLKKAPFLNLAEDFHNQVPAITFSTARLRCNLVFVSSQPSTDTSLLLRDYLRLDSRVHLLGVALRYWALQSKVESLRDGSGGLPTYALDLLLVSFLQKQAVLPCIHNWLQPGSKVYSSPTQMLTTWKSENEASGAELWVELFRWLALGLRGEGVISVCGEDEKTDFRGRRLTIEDPYAAKKNLCANLSQGELDYLADCFKASYLYFGTLQTCLGPIFEVLRPIDELVDDEDKEDSDSASHTTLGESFEPAVDCFEDWLAVRGTSLTLKEAIMTEKLVPPELVAFSMTAAKLSLGSPPEPHCTICSGTHSTSCCPEDRRLEVAPLPQLDVNYKLMMEALLGDVVKSYHPAQEELLARKKCLQELTAFVTLLWPDARLALFGSSCNGFSFRNSDLDISVTFKGVEGSEEIDCVGLVEELASHLSTMKGVTRVLPITGAKVPIVKLFHKKFNIEADISLYNVLARENSAMLALYAAIDERFKVLGYLVKIFAKCCGVCDASKGSLSSYAYLLMMLYYLQQVKPPVLPVLQQLYPEGERQPEHFVEGWNAWFFTFDNISQLKRRWPLYGFNTCSVLQLWTGFLGFYAAHFEDKVRVVSVRQKDLLFKFEKQWNSSRLAIEDPFDLSHNLGSGLSHKMWLYIRKAFAKGRQVFGWPLPHLPSNARSLQEYLFSGALFVTGPPPRETKGKDCYECGKIGHIAAYCPRRIKQREKKRLESVHDGNSQRNEIIGERNESDSNKGPKPVIGDHIRVKSGQLAKERARDINDNFDYNSLKHMEVDPNQASIDYLMPRDVILDEPEFVTLEDVSSVCVTDLRCQGLASSPKHGVDVEEMKKVNNDMMRQCEKISKRCKEARRRK